MSASKLLVLATAIGLLGCGTKQHPTDAELAAELAREKPTYETLAQMFEKDSAEADGPVVIDGSWSNEEQGKEQAELGVNDDRWNEYLELMRTIDLTRGLEKLERAPHCVLFRSSPIGPVSSGSTKGLARCSEPPERQVASLDARPDGLPELSVAFKPIEHEWYVFYDWSN